VHPVKYNKGKISFKNFLLIKNLAGMINMFAISRFFHWLFFYYSPAPILVRKLVGLLESIEKLPIYLYESSTSFSLQVSEFVDFFEI